MANPEHIALLKGGVAGWNAWREEHVDIAPDLERADLAGAELFDTDCTEANLRLATLGKSAPSMMPFSGGANLRGAKLSWANLRGADLRAANLLKVVLFQANLRGAKLTWADLRHANLGGANLEKANLGGARLHVANLHGADLNGADLSGANLWNAGLGKANLRGANLSGVDLRGADLSEADLSGAHLSGADLSDGKLYKTILNGATLRATVLERATLVETDLSGATLADCSVYGVSAWAVKLSDMKQQSNLRVTPPDEPEITVDNLKVAQFIYLMLHNEEIRNVIDTIGEKGVLILGRFTTERKAVLDAIRNKLRELGFVPMMFDFEKPTQRDFTETIKTLAGMSRFIIADITNPKSSPLELQATMPDYMIPFVPIIHEEEEPFSMFRDLKQKYGDWVLDVLEYDSADSLLRVMDKAIVAPAIEKADELLLKKAEEIKKRHVSEYM